MKLPKSLRAIATAAGLGFLLPTLIPAAPPATREPADGPTEVARDANAFGLDVFARVAAGGRANEFLSPASLSTALAMAYAGARGTTAEEMGAVLHLTHEGQRLHRAVGELADRLRRDRSGLKVSIANALWGQAGYPFRPEFLDLGAEDYGAALRSVDFEGATEKARETINAWVRTETSGKIDQLFPEGSLDTLTRLVLTNAIYFKGVWTRQFDPQQTTREPFHTAPDATVQADMMHARDTSWRYLETDDLQGLELPYGDGEVSMIVLLPAEGRTLETIESELTVDRLEDWVSRMGVSHLDLVALPRFKMSCRYALSDVLGRMGMRQAFTAQADFSGIASGGHLHLSDVVHEAVVEVNEEGTEAAAATGVAVRAASLRPPRIFRVDRPFLFVIRDEATGAILFVGRVVDPTRP